MSIEIKQIPKDEYVIISQVTIKCNSCNEEKVEKLQLHNEYTGDTCIIRIDKKLHKFHYVKDLNVYMCDNCFKKIN